MRRAAARLLASLPVTSGCSSASVDLADPLVEQRSAATGQRAERERQLVGVARVRRAGQVGGELQDLGAVEAVGVVRARRAAGGRRRRCDDDPFGLVVGHQPAGERQVHTARRRRRRTRRPRARR